MTICSSCRAPNAPGANFCSSCGARLLTRPPAAAQRKVLTVLFSDITDSVGLADSLDPEAWQEILRDYFTEMSRILSHHGATIEKFIGDAIQGVFGLETTHEDDARRAVSAALEMQAAGGELNRAFADRWGVTLQVRIGIHTGEVVAGDPDHGQPFAVGDVMNVAARLQQIAEPGEVLISPSTYERVRERVEVQDLGPRTLKGKPEPVHVYRLLKMGAEADRRRSITTTPLVGRSSELEQLDRAFRDAVATNSFVTCTIVGDAGMGKTRIAHELAASLEGSARVLWGYAGPYDASNTLAPIAQVARQALELNVEDARQDVVDKVASIAQRIEVSPDALEVLVGISERSIHERDLYYAFRRLLESEAAELPHVVILDDLHWANPHFLNLVGYLEGWGSGAAVLVVCLGRPEVLERDAGVANVLQGPTIRLRALPSEGAEDLLRKAGADDVDPAVVRRIIELTGGNPLFLEEMVDMLAASESDSTSLPVPDSIRDLLRARIDSVAEKERLALQHASVVGQTFWWQAVNELADDETRPEIDILLDNLWRRALIQPSSSQLKSEDAYSFTNALLREVVYAGIPKMIRSRAHQIVAHWLTARSDDHHFTLDDIIGFHLEQAFAYLQQVGVRGAELRSVAEAAETHLRTAGRRALDRWDFTAAAGLLTRAVRVGQAASTLRWETAIDAAEALIEIGELSEAKEAIASARSAADASSDRRGAAHAEVYGTWLEIRSDNPAGWSDAARRQTEGALKTFEELEDPIGLARAHELLGDVYFTNGEHGRGEKELRAAANYARQAEDVRAETRLLTYLAAVLLWGPTPVPEAIERCEEILDRMSSSRWGRAKVALVLGGLYAMDGSFDRSDQLITEAKMLMEELGMSVTLATGRQISSLAYSLAGRSDDAAKELRLGYDELERTQNRGFLATAATYLARALIENQELDDVPRLLERAKEIAPSDDDVAQAEIAIAEAMLLAGRGDPEAATLSDRAQEVFGRTDELNDRADVLLCHALILEDLGRSDEARRAASEAELLYRRKGVKPRLAKAAELAGSEGAEE